MSRYLTREEQDWLFERFGIEIDDLNTEELADLAQSLGMDVTEDELETWFSNWDEIAKAASNAAHEALEAEGEYNREIPDDIALAAMLLELATKMRVTAIKKVERTHYVPSEKPAEGMAIWQMKRATGQLTRHDPKVIKEHHKVWGFYLYRKWPAANPVEAEGWLRDYGFTEAFATSPSFVEVARI